MSGVKDPTRKTEYPDHAYVEERLSAYLDGQLAADERQIVDRHLAACAACRWSLETLRQTVLWTRNLPTAPVPRSFTLPVAPARQPARARVPARRWRLVPAFQLATALVAMLLFFAVAGDFALTGMRPASMPAPQVMLEQAADSTQMIETVEVEATQAVELLQEAPAGAVPAQPQAEDTAQRSAAESEPATLQAQPAATAAAAAEEPTIETYALTEAEAAAATAAPPGMGGEVAPTVEETLVAEATPVPSIASDSTAQMEMMVAPETTPTATLISPRANVTPGAPRPAPSATPVPSAMPAPLQAPPTEAPLAKTMPPEPEAPVPPTAVVEVEEPVEALAAAEEPQAEAVREAESAVADGALRAQAINWLRLLEYGLGAALVLLLGTTVALMIWRRRAR